MEIELVYGMQTHHIKLAIFYGVFEEYVLPHMSNSDKGMFPARIFVLGVIRQ